MWYTSVITNMKKTYGREIILVYFWVAVGMSGVTYDRA